MINCEYLVYLTSGLELSICEYDRVYEILTTLKFPLRLNPMNSSAVDILSTEERKLLRTDERQIILKKMKEINKDIEIIPFPKSLLQFYLYAATENCPLSKYHLSLISTYKSVINAVIDLKRQELREQLQALKANLPLSISAGLEFNFDNYCVDARRELDTEINSFFDGGKTSDFFKACKKANDNKHLKQIWKSLNKSLVAEIIRNDFKTNLISLLTSFSINWPQKFYAISVNRGKHLEHYEFNYMNVKENLMYLSKALYLEAHISLSPKFATKYLVYRGSNFGPWGDYNLLLNEKRHTLSFGDGLCAGIVNDSDATPWYYMQQTKCSEDWLPKTGYMLFLDVNNIETYMTIPPLTCIAQTFGYGEDFHVRSKSLVKCHNIPEYVIQRSFILSDLRRLRLQIGGNQIRSLLFSDNLARNYVKEQMYQHPEKFALIVR